MTNTKDSFLADAWNRILEYLLANGKIDPTVMDTFYRTSYIEELNDRKAVIVTDNIIAKQVMSQNADMVSAAIAELSYSDGMIPVEFIQASELESLLKTKTIDPVIELDDEPGRAAEALAPLTEKGINIAYLYSFLLKGKGVLVYKVR